MVRNLYMRKPWPSSPTRSCRNSTGPRDVSLMSSAHTNPSVTVRGAVSTATPRSRPRLLRERAGRVAGAESARRALGTRSTGRTGGSAGCGASGSAVAGGEATLEGATPPSPRWPMPSPRFVASGPQPLLAAIPNPSPQARRRGRTLVPQHAPFRPWKHDSEPSGCAPSADTVPGGGSSFRRALPRLPTMLAVIWHYWIGVALALGAIATVGALVVGYLRQVESTRYPKGR